MEAVLGLYLVCPTAGAGLRRHLLPLRGARSALAVRPGLTTAASPCGGTRARWCTASARKPLPRLAQNLGDAHATADPRRTAHESLLGWIEAAGPADENGVTATPCLAAEYGFRSLPFPRNYAGTGGSGGQGGGKSVNGLTATRGGKPLPATAPPSRPPGLPLWTRGRGAG